MTARTAHAASIQLSAASLGSQHGYRVEGDTAYLNAEIVRCHPEALDADWSLQLWACPEPFTGGHIAGTKVAEVPTRTLANAPTTIVAADVALLPAGSQAHAMVMVLASREPGGFATIHDFANYPQPQSFVLPRLQGAVGYRFDGETVHLQAEGVENPRDSDNLSGTLALELWALAEPYQGGDFVGTELAGVSIGSLTGGSALHNLSYQLPLNQSVIGQAATGEVYVVLMLREWTARGYVTRDYTCFTQPVALPGNIQLPVQDAPKASKTAQPRASRSAKVLSAMLSSVVPAAKQRAKGASEDAASTVAAADSTKPSKEEVLRVRGKGRKLLAKLSVIPKSKQH